MSHPLFRCFALFFLLIICPLSSADARMLEGRVVGVRDGDTIELLDAARERHVIRLAHIDTPEKAQPYGNRAKQFVTSLVYGKTVGIEVTDRDR